VGKPSVRLLTWGIDSLDGQQAHRIGLADYLIDGDVVEDALARAESLAALPRRQAEATKPYFAADISAEASDDAALDLFLAITDSPEAARLFAARRLKGDLEVGSSSKINRNRSWITALALSGGLTLSLELARKPVAAASVPNAIARPHWTPFDGARPRVMHFGDDVGVTAISQEHTLP
jgi:hypothetical protein